MKSKKLNIVISLSIIFILLYPFSSQAFFSNIFHPGNIRIVLNRFTTLTTNSLAKEVTAESTALFLDRSFAASAASWMAVAPGLFHVDVVSPSLISDMTLNQEIVSDLLNRRFMVGVPGSTWHGILDFSFLGENSTLETIIENSAKKIEEALSLYPDQSNIEVALAGIIDSIVGFQFFNFSQSYPAHNMAKIMTLEIDPLGQVNRGCAEFYPIMVLLEKITSSRYLDEIGQTEMAEIVAGFSSNIKQSFTKGENTLAGNIMSMDLLLIEQMLYFLYLGHAVEGKARAKRLAAHPALLKAFEIYKSMALRLGRLPEDQRAIKIGAFVDKIQIDSVTNMLGLTEVQIASNGKSIVTIPRKF